MIVARIPLVKERAKLKYMHARGMMGGIAMTCAFFAVQNTNMAVANTLMFTVPVWTGVFSYLVLGKLWKRWDVALAITSLCGVMMVADPWGTSGLNGYDDDTPADSADTGTSTDPWLAGIGYAAALTFGIVNGAAAILINTHLREESMVSMTLLQMVYIFMVGLFFSLTLPMANHVDYDVKHGEYSFGYSLSDLFRPVHGDGSSHEHAYKKMFLVTLLGIGMVGMQGLRNGGMAVSRDSTVVIALYFEVALAFLWTAAILKDDLNVYQFVGCAVIV
eukprot:CAMPEP_0205906084 /NCGR_PEP_ID=MMETSP1325-20131115/1744_1 /ASSEMBLY_ACC=CAM_ASM_000708 /TAXON_ID=236786 /ORGANISM="Florenciella sp., Strain RCC1007" /LENGTH=275 /DNA_ID=CAMNT_0053272069 /DNA_START=39 /DNA_END=863 /DNA_ORIENTATION=-